MKIKIPFLKKRRKSREQAARERIQRKKIKLEELDLDNRIDKKLNPSITNASPSPRKSALQVELARIKDAVKAVKDLREMGLIEDDTGEEPEENNDILDIIKLLKPELYNNSMGALNIPRESDASPVSSNPADMIISNLPDFVIKQVQEGSISQAEFEKLASSYSNKIVKDVYKKLIKG